MARRFWTCQRVSKGKKCAARNPATKQICLKCGKKRPPRKKPEHMKVLSEMPYEEWAELFGDDCNICGRKPNGRRRHARDHDHKTGAARGILCVRCNRALPSWMDANWLRKAADYLDRVEVLGANDPNAGGDK